MTDQTETESERAELLADLEFYTQNDYRNPMQTMPRAQGVIDNAIAAIRALESQVADGVRALQSMAGRWQVTIADRDRIAAELRGTQTRMSEIAGEVFNLRADVMQWQVYFKTMVEFSAHNHARLTSELAAARDEIASMRSNAQDIKAAIREAEHGDAARSAGGGG